jgi:hypothetical protein
MLPEISQLNEKEQKLLEELATADPASIALKFYGKPGIDGQKISQQLLARQKAKTKLPGWYNNPRLVFPPPVSVEQASSQATAAYKAGLINGKCLADLTLGMGVDSYYFSKRFDHVKGFELNPDLAAITQHNLTELGATNVSIVSGSGEDVSPEDVDHIFIDPSRRDDQKKKTVAFEDSNPNVLTLLPRWSGNPLKIMIKSSPLIDLDQAASQLGAVSEIHVVGYQKECKEVLFLLNPSRPSAYPVIHAVIVDEAGRVLHHQQFTKQEEANYTPHFGDPQGFLYEPHAAFLKAGGYNQLAKSFQLHKVARSSHLYYSDDVRADFPGRIFKIRGVENASGFSWKKWLKEPKANLTIRNFPGHTDDLRKKWSLKEGGQVYLFATTLYSQRKVVIITEKATY